MSFNTFSSSNFGNSSINMNKLDYSYILNSHPIFKSIGDGCSNNPSNVLISSTLSSNIETYSFGNASYEIKTDEYKEIDKIIEYQYKNVDYSNVSADGFRVQGVTQIGDKLVLSAYDHDEIGGKKNSRLYIYDINTGDKEGYVILNSDAHSGGTTYVDDLGILFVSNAGGKTMALDFSEDKFNLLVKTIKANSGYIDFSKNDTMLYDQSIIINNNINVSDITDVGKNSTMFCSDGYLYVATYNNDIQRRAEVVKFKIDKDDFTKSHYETDKYVKGKLNATVENKYVIPDMTQGVAASKYNGEDYIFTSQSYSGKDSIITVQKVTPYGLEYVGAKIIDHPGAESLHVGPAGELICVFEKGDATVYSITMNKLFNNFSDEDDVNSIRNSQIDWSEAGDYGGDYVKRYKNNDYGNFVFDFSDAVGEDGFCGSIGAIYDESIETTEDIIGFFHHGAKSIFNDIFG